MNLAKKGFTLIELLVVIAIISILAAIIFPVFAQARKSAYRSADTSNLDQLQTALQLYKTDQGAYPPALLGYVTQYAGGPNPTIGDVLPANLVQGALFPKRVDSLDTFRPALDRSVTGGNFNAEFTTAVWPSGQGVGSAPNMQKFGPNDGNVLRAYRAPDGTCTDIPSYFYRLSGYDVATVDVPGGGTRTELHYAPFWTGYTVPTDPCNPVDATGSASDEPRQLGYTDPPDTTVVTWDSYFRDYDANGNTLREKQDIVLFLGGSARPYDSAAMASEAWQAKP